MAMMGSADVAEIDALRAEVGRLKDQLAKTKARDFHFLGEVIAADLVADLTRGGKLSARGVQTKRDGMHGDGGNLWLQVTPGGRSWLFRYRWGQKQREMGLGAVSEIPLSEARARASICRRLVREGVDPIERRRALAATEEPAKRSTFKDAAQRYFDAKKAGWRSAKHTVQFPNTMRDYVYPIIGEMPVQEIDTDRVLKILEQELRDSDGKEIGRLWTTRPETASRVRARIEQVLDWAAARRMRHGDNPARWRGHLSSLLPERKKVKAVDHHPALPYADAHSFWQALDTRKSASAEALRFTILTAARTGEVIGARWSEVDLEAKVWTVPADRMKVHRQHRFPLSKEAVEILERMKALKDEGGGYVFPGATAEGPLSNMAMAMMVRKMSPAEGPPRWVDHKGSPIVPHGFRSTFRDWAAELTAHPNEMVEMALAHTVGNKVEAAYRRGDMFERRRRLMEDWATHCTTAPAAKSDNVHQIGEAR
jgi:integrase